MPSFNQIWKPYNHYCYSDKPWHQKSGPRGSAQATKGNSGYDEEKAGKGCAGGQDLALAFPHKFHLAQYCLLGPVWRPRPLVIEAILQNFLDY